MFAHNSVVWGTRITPKTTSCWRGLNPRQCVPQASTLQPRLTGCVKRTALSTIRRKNQGSLCVSNHLAKEVYVCQTIEPRKFMCVKLLNYFFLQIVLSAVLLTQLVSLGCKVLTCGTHWRGFKSRQHEAVFEVILVPQSNSIMCKHNII